jgi:hypothetical protein
VICVFDPEIGRGEVERECTALDAGAFTEDRGGDAGVLALDAPQYSLNRDGLCA